MATADFEVFRSGVEKAVLRDEEFDTVTRDDRADGAALVSRFPVAEKLWIDLTIRPAIPQIRAGIVTDDRWVNEELEDAIEETGDSMAEFVELGFDEAGLDWREPVVEHYREQGKYFYFSTGFELPDLSALKDPEIAEKTIQMLKGYYEAFRAAIEKVAAGADE